MTTKFDNFIYLDEPVSLYYSRTFEYRNGYYYKVKTLNGESFKCSFIQKEKFEYITWNNIDMHFVATVRNIVSIEIMDTVPELLYEDLFTPQQMHYLSERLPNQIQIIIYLQNKKKEWIKFYENTTEFTASVIGMRMSSRDIKVFEQALIDISEAQAAMDDYDKQLDTITNLL
jgi:hypothetical protein